MASNTSKVSLQAQLQQILAGIASTYQGVSTLTFGGKTYALTDLTKLIQTELDALTASAKAKATYALQVQTERNARAALTPVLRPFKNYVLATLGDTQNSVQALAAFGFTPRKVPALTAAEKAGAQAKALATRKAKEPAKTAQPSGATPATVPALAATKA
jgi:hypothetical protein